MIVPLNRAVEPLVAHRAIDGWACDGAAWAQATLGVAGTRTSHNTNASARKNRRHEPQKSLTRLKKQEKQQTTKQNGKPCAKQWCATQVNRPQEHQKKEIIGGNDPLASGTTPEEMEEAKGACTDWAQTATQLITMYRSLITIHGSLIEIMRSLITIHGSLEISPQKKKSNH